MDFKFSFLSLYVVSEGDGGGTGNIPGVFHEFVSDNIFVTHHPNIFRLMYSHVQQFIMHLWRYYRNISLLG